MTDRRYKLKEVYAGPLVWTQRRAVLFPCFPKLYKEKKGFVTLMNRLRSRWHKRLTSLRNAGWEPVEHLLDFQYMRNCPPFGGRTAIISRSCRRWFCPFCWAREVTGPLYQRLTRLLQVGEGQFRTDLKLVQLTRIKVYDRKVPGLPLKCITFLDNRTAELDMLKGVRGGFVNCTVEPFDKYVRLIRRTVAIVASNTRVAPPKENGLSWRECEANYGNIITITSGVGRYPARILSARPLSLMNAFRWLRKRRLRAYYGCLRGIPLRGTSDERSAGKGQRRVGAKGGRSRGETASECPANAGAD